MKKILFLTALVWATEAFPQARIVMSNVKINLANGGKLVIQNANPDALSFSGNSGIISEGENNLVRWNIGANAGTYTVPFQTAAGTDIPLTFDLSGGVGSGYIDFSTYPTGTWQNSANLPSSVANVNSLSGDNSAFIIDRFWQINPQGYTTKPTLSNLTFSYQDSEHSAGGNTIVESNLGAQRWDSDNNTWMTMGPIGNTNPATNKTTVSNVNNADFYGWWTLVDKSSPMPVELISFTGNHIEGENHLFWATASEMNNAGFMVERSADAQLFENLGFVQGKGSSTEIQSYKWIDTKPFKGTSFYRLKQLDLDGNYSYSQIIELNSNLIPEIQLYPNPTKGIVYLSGADIPEQQIKTFNAVGQPITLNLMANQINLNDQPAGIYYLQIFLDKNKFTTLKVVRD